MTGRVRIGSVAAAFSLAAGFAIPLFATPAAGQDDAGGAVIRTDEVLRAFQLCPANTGGIEVVLALDRSGSLTIEDPEGRSRRRAIESMRRFTESFGEDADFSIDLALLSFDTEARLHAGFERISSTHPSDEDITAAVADGIGNTDYLDALEEALDLFENSPQSRDRNICRVLFFFTDGILDPFNTVTRLGNLRASDQRVAAAEAHAEELIRDACLGSDSYKDRLKDLDVNTIAVLLGESFKQRDASHRGSMTVKSLQLIQALTRHLTSELIRDIAPHPACEQWTGGGVAGVPGDSEAGSGGGDSQSGSDGDPSDPGASDGSSSDQSAASESDGLVISLDGVGGLVETIEAVGEEFDLVKRQPKLDCRPVPSEAEIVGVWPGHAVAEGICTVEAPEDGRAYISVAEIADDAGEIDWGLSFGSGSDPGGEDRVEIQSGDGERDLHALSTRFPDDRLSSSSRATLIVSIEWRPESSQSDVQAIRSPPVEIEYDRDAHFQPNLACKDWTPASVVPNDERSLSVVADDVCEVSSTGAGETALVPVGDRLDWRPVPCESGDCRSWSLRSDLTDGLTYAPFEEKVRVGLEWRSPSGALLWSGVDEDGRGADGRDDLEEVAVEVDLGQAEPPHLDCSGDPPEVAGSGGEVPDEPLQVDTGCVLRPPTGGQVTVEVVEGDSSAGGVDWMLPGGAVTLRRGDDAVPLIVLTDGPLPNARFDDSVSLKLRAEWQAPGIEPGEKVEEQSISFRLDFKARSNNLLALLWMLVALLMAAALAWAAWYWMFARRDRLPDADRVYGWRHAFPVGTGLSGGVDASVLRSWQSWPVQTAGVRSDGDLLSVEGLKVRSVRPSFFDFRGVVGGRAARVSGPSGWTMEAWPQGPEPGTLAAAKLHRGAVVLGLPPNGGEGAVWAVYPRRGGAWPEALAAANPVQMLQRAADRRSRGDELLDGPGTNDGSEKSGGPPLHPRGEEPRQPSEPPSPTGGNRGDADQRPVIGEPPPGKPDNDRALRRPSGLAPWEKA